MSFLAFLNQLLREGDPDFRDTHKHRCGYVPRGEEPKHEERGGCGLVWEHDRPPPGTSATDYAVAHKCPGCGKINMWRYHGRVKIGNKTLREKANG